MFRSLLTSETENVSLHSRYCTSAISTVRINKMSGYWQNNRDFFRHPVYWIMCSFSSANQLDYGDKSLDIESVTQVHSVVRLSFTSTTPTYICILVFMSLLTREVDDMFVHTSNMFVMGPRTHTQFIFTVLAHRRCWCIQLTRTHYLYVVPHYALLEIWMQHSYVPCNSVINILYIIHNAVYLISRFLKVA